MKKIIFVLMSLLLISSVSALSIGSVRYFEDIFLVNVHSAEDLEDLRVRVMVMNDDIDVYSTKTFDLDINENKGTYVIIDEPLYEETLVKITVRNDDVRKVRYMIIWFSI